MLTDDIFGLPERHYLKYRITNPIDTYKEAMKIFLSRMHSLSEEEAKRRVDEILRKKKNPTTTYYERDMDTGDKEVQTTGLEQYIVTMSKQRLITAPSFTCYVPHKYKKSHLVDFIQNRMMMRSKYKKIAIPAKAKGDMKTYNIYNPMQQVMKRDNNSVSGLLTVRGSELYDYSAHYTLTSTTRCLTAIGNVITERMVSGNRYYKDPDSVFNDISMALYYEEHEEIKKAIRTYNLHLPTPEEAMDVVLYSSRLYWINDELENKIYEYLSKLTPEERAVFVYAGDLYHLKKFNKKFVYDMLNDICVKIEPNTDIDVDKVVSETHLSVINLVSLILMEEIKGLGANISDYPDITAKTFASTCISVTNKLNKYLPILKPICTTPHLPPNPAYIPDMLRRSILLSDTDSTCGEYGSWIADFFSDGVTEGEVKFTPETIALAATVMTITTQTMAHYHKIYSARMGIDIDYMTILRMKNEFFWTTMTPMQVSKHYFASTMMQEGNVYKEPELELKGVHLIASKVPKAISERAHKIMSFINRETYANRKISISLIVREVAKMEERIIEQMRAGNAEYLNFSRIKPIEEYMSNPMATPYFSHAMWMEVFADKYGVVDIPPYVAVKYNLTINTRTDMVNWIKNINDRDIAERLQSFMEKHNKTVLKTIYLDAGYVANNKVPEEIFMVIDYRKVTLDMCNVFYIMLESLGFYKPSEKLILDILD